MHSEADPSTTASFRRACRELVERIVAGEVEREGLEQAKLDVCGQVSAPKVPTNADILEASTREERAVVEPIVRRKPVRTVSGVSPVAIMTSPAMCPHGKCLYCPGGPASDFSSAQSYTGHEPAAARGRRHDYDPFDQVADRLAQLRTIGHPVDKVELILMGGTMTARSHDYQEWFVKRALEAMNAFDPDTNTVNGRPDTGRSFTYLEDVKARNERATVRNIGTTFETKPDWCGREQIDRMLRLGGTKVELGVQTTFDDINRAMHRGHGTAASREANRALRDAGFKVGFHMMPGQPGMTEEMIIEDFRRLFDDSDWRPDYLKIYPTLVVKGTRVYDMWRRGDFEPLSNETAASLVAEIKAMLPEYVRLQRVQRDIPADFIEAGVWKSNLRQLARARLESRDETCACIRCREVGHADGEPEDPAVSIESYPVAGGVEHFIQIADPESDVLIGFCRLRFPGDPHRPELREAAIVRELHVYGSELAIGRADARSGGEAGGGGAWQHRGIGSDLLSEAERLAAEAGYPRLAVISGIGARPYYRDQHGYRQDGPYVTKRLR